MGVGKYNVTRETTPTNLDFSGAAYKYPGAQQGPPPGMSANMFDQTNINWNYAQKLGAERATQNQDIQKVYAEGYNQWLNNGQKGPPPNAPAQFETDPYKIYNHLNTSTPGILLQGGVVSDNRMSMGQMDPIAYMFEAGKPNPAGPAYQSTPAPAANAAAPTVPNFGTNLPPQPAMGPVYNPALPPGTPSSSLPPATMPPMAQNPSPNPAGQVNSPQPAAPGATSPTTNAGQPPDWWMQMMQYFSGQNGATAPWTRFGNPYAGQAQQQAAPAAPQAPAAPTTTAPAATGRENANPTGQRAAVSPYVAPTVQPAQAGNRSSQPSFSLRGRNNYGSGWNNRY